MMLTTAQAAEKLGISPRRVLELIKAGRLPAQPFGRTYMIQERDLALVKNRKPGRPRKKDNGERRAKKTTSERLKHMTQDIASQRFNL